MDKFRVTRRKFLRIIEEFGGRRNEFCYVLGWHCYSGDHEIWVWNAQKGIRRWTDYGIYHAEIIDIIDHLQSRIEDC